jgi:hypothetical protein
MGCFLDAGRFALSLFLHLSIFKADQGLCFNVHDFPRFLLSSCFTRHFNFCFISIHTKTLMSGHVYYLKTMLLHISMCYIAHAVSPRSHQESWRISSSGTCHQTRCGICAPSSLPKLPSGPQPQRRKDQCSSSRMPTRYQPMPLPRTCSWGMSLDRSLDL